MLSRLSQLRPRVLTGRIDPSSTLRLLGPDPAQVSQGLSGIVGLRVDITAVADGGNGGTVLPLLILERNDLDEEVPSQPSGGRLSSDVVEDPSTGN